MDEHSMLRFFNQLIIVVKQKVKNIGIITDKDGTIFLNDNLRETLHNFREKELGANIYVIANSGRTIQDMINCLEKENIPINYFDYIIGDNGGVCLDIRNNRELYKHVIDKEVVLEVIQKFLEIGGDISDIRLTDGSNIFAYPAKEVEEYYRDAKDIVFREDITDLDGIDVTKLTVTASHDKIQSLNRFIKDSIKGYETHIGKTSFPIESRNNYRIDFTRRTYKGKGSQRFKRKTRT